MKSVRVYSDEIEELYNGLSAVRMPAAKHELPRKRGEEVLSRTGPEWGSPTRTPERCVGRSFSTTSRQMIAEP
jgi:hypothetical protein